MSASVSLIGGGLLAVLIGSYIVQKYLPPPVPRIVGFDLGTTYSSAAVYHAGTGEVEIIEDDKGRKAFPSVVAFLENGSVVIGHEAVAQSEHNPTRTFYDAKRFIGKTFNQEEFNKEIAIYPFEVRLENGQAHFFCPPDRKISPEEIGSIILQHLKTLTEKQLALNGNSVKQCVMSAPAEFNDFQRNSTKLAAAQAKMDVLRIINEPTAAALAYGLHKKEGVEFVMIVDLGGGTLDVSLLLIQGGMFITTAMAGNNHLGGQDFNVRILTRLVEEIERECAAGGQPEEVKNQPEEVKGQLERCRLVDKEDMQNLRLAVETAKLELTSYLHTTVNISLHSLPDPRTNRSPFNFVYKLTRAEFEALNDDLLKQVLNPIQAALDDAQLTKDRVDEIVLVGGSTRIPKIRRIITDFFGKPPNYGVDPELAVVTGVAIQAGVISGGWPLQVAATELPAKLKKVHVYREDF